MEPTNNPQSRKSNLRYTLSEFCRGKLKYCKTTVIEMMNKRFTSLTSALILSTVLKSLNILGLYTIFLLCKVVKVEF